MSKATTDSPAPNLGKFEKRDVVAAAIEIRNAAGGLNEALGIMPQRFEIGAKAFVLLEVDCVGIDHEPVKDTGVLKRIHVFKAAGATMIDEADARPRIEYQRDQIQRAKDSAAGQGRLDDDPTGLTDEGAARIAKAARDGEADGDVAEVGPHPFSDAGTGRCAICNLSQNAPVHDLAES